MPPIPPVTKGEFLQLLQRCMPPVGWPHHLGAWCACAARTSSLTCGALIVVGNSAGPDSTCLLHLLSSVINTRGPSPGLPRHLFSVHIDHGLQASSRAMAKQAADTAKALGVEHRERVISWPSEPAEGDSFEEVARDARNIEFSQAMSTMWRYTVAYGHHADDLVETVVMRLSKGSSIQHACGMRPVRRMGMSTGRKLVEVSPLGMIRWIVRPLLSVSKDRILATCDANGWQYVNDPTNFQPDITLRNSIRHWLSQEGSADAAAQLASSVTEAIQTLHGFAPSMQGRAALREAVAHLSRRTEMIDAQVTNHLEHCVLPSPPSTLLLSTAELLKITDHEVRIALVRRVLRYVSPRPWGSPQAEAGGRHKSLESIVRALWNTTPTARTRTSFTNGGNVLWRPMVVGPNGRIKERKKVFDGETPAWLACRARPSFWSMRGEGNTVERDITRDLENLEPDNDNVIMYDCRFALAIRKEMLPDSIMDTVTGPNPTARIVIQPANKWYMPQVVWQQDGKEDEVLASFDWEDRIGPTAKPPSVQVDPSWVTMNFIRKLSSL
ncbi:PP-loop family-domain-containing protein [Amylocystis lapponica]|nr:PP-loop family-domain-containing protein [Amylocystis lapponica]